MRLIRANVEREADGVAAEKLMNEGFEVIEEGTADPVPSEIIEAKKNPDEMTLEELKALAKEKGLSGVSALTKKDLLEILKG